MLYQRYHFTLLPRILLSALLSTLVVSASSVSSRAQQLPPLERKVESGAGAKEEEKKSLINMGWTLAPPIVVIKARPEGGERNVVIKAEDQQDEGNVVVAIGRVE